MILIEYNPVHPVWVSCFSCGIWHGTSQTRVWIERISRNEQRTYCDSCKKKLEREVRESQTQSSR